MPSTEQWYEMHGQGMITLQCSQSGGGERNMEK